MTLTTENLLLTSRTPVQKFYSGQNILITGGTGFLGKVLIEKLLRTCPDLSSIYIIVRSKKGQDAHRRLDSLFDEPLFDLLKKESPKFQHKISAIAGDCSLPGLGISAADKELILREINIVFNVAATVRFDEKLKYAVGINVACPREILRMCRNMQNLKSVIHVSTAYSNCTILDIDEKIYEPPITGDNVIKLVQSLDEKRLESITPILLGDIPNTYAFTKCIGEQVVQQYGRDLPAGIFRPAIVTPSYKEPIVGWVDNLFGPTGALVAAGAGLLRTLNLDPKCTVELVPADYTVNALIASAWDVANFKNEDDEPPVYNYHANWSEGLTWQKYMDLAFKYGKKQPSIRSIWCYSVTVTKSYFLFFILSTLLHIIPALLIDSVLVIAGKDPKILKLYKKIHKYSKFTMYFSTKKWTFANKNTRAMWEKLTAEDRENFSFSMKDFDWDDYIKRSIHGLRLFIFKESPDNIPMARKRMAKFVLLHKIIKYSILALSLWFLYSAVHFIISVGVNIGFTTVTENVSIR